MAIKPIQPPGYITPHIFEQLGWLTVISTRRGETSSANPYGANFGWLLPENLSLAERSAEQRRIARRLNEIKNHFGLNHIAVVATEHKNKIITPDTDDPRTFALHPGERHMADGFYINTPRFGAAIFPADCAIIVLADAANRHFCMVHAGWRGLYSGIITDGVNHMLSQGAKAKNLLAYIAPHAKDRFPLSRAETVAQFKDKFPAHTHEHLIDQTGIAAHQLMNAGVASGRIEISPYNTLTHQDFYSHHYPDPEGEGRFLVLAAITS